jgi:GR25 family glycosyltransferase involved in LPS biosynthesis
MSIDWVSYINLDNRLERRAHIEKILSHSPYNYDRIAAVRLSDSPESLGYKMHSSVRGQSSTASIFLSHKKTLESALDKVSSGSLLLLEDDVEISPSYWLNEINTEHLPEDWQILNVSLRYRQKEKTKELLLEKNYADQKFLRIADIKNYYIVTGAHFVLFRDIASIQHVLKKMNETSGIYNVDGFYYIEDINTYTTDHDLIDTKFFPSDHD